MILVTLCASVMSGLIAAKMSFGTAVPDEVLAKIPGRMDDIVNDMLFNQVSNRVFQAFTTSGYWSKPSDMEGEYVFVVAVGIGGSGYSGAGTPANGGTGGSGGAGIPMTQYPQLLFPLMMTLDDTHFYGGNRGGAIGHGASGGISDAIRAGDGGDGTRGAGRNGSDGVLYIFYSRRIP